MEGQAFPNRPSEYVCSCLMDRQALDNPRFWVRVTHLIQIREETRLIHNEGLAVNVEGSVVDDHLLSEKIQIERKQFFFDLKENPRGRFLKITEDVGGRRDTIIIPSTGLDLFRDTINHAIEADKEHASESSEVPA